MSYLQDETCNDWPIEIIKSWNNFLTIYYFFIFFNSPSFYNIHNNLFYSFPDNEVRKVAVQWIRCIGSDELVDYLPQLVQALKYETFEGSPLAHFLLERALMSPRVAHHLFWLLVQSLPAGDAPQNNVSSDFNDMMPDDRTIAASRYQRRLQLMLRSLYTVSGSALQQRFTSQQLLVKVSFFI